MILNLSICSLYSLLAPLSQVCEQVARQVPKQICRQEERQECYNIPREVPRQECTQVPTITATCHLLPPAIHISITL